MITFPNAKINLGLFITGKRPDGYHNIESLIIPVDLFDILEIIENKENSNEILFSCSGLTIDGDPADNLICKAINLLKKDYAIPPVKIHLHKNIPMGAGLGGGSADAAFALKLINQKFNLSIPPEKLEDYCRKIGSDCAFFIKNNAAFVSGKGDIMEETTFSLNDYEIRFIHPEIHVSTAEAYAGITPKQPSIPLKKIIAQPVEQWKSLLINDFEETVLNKYPVIAKAKAELYNAGAIYSAMSGSGSTVFGLFRR